MMEQAIEVFVAEAEELLADLEDLLLSLEADASAARVDEVFRALHTIKGSGSMFGYTALARFTHHFENAYEMVRSEELFVTGKLVDLSLTARDLMAKFLALGGDGEEAEALLVSDEANELIAKLTSLTGSPQVESSQTDVAQDVAVVEGEKSTRVFDITLVPASEALKNGMRPDLLVRELADLGDVTVSYDISNVPSLADLDPASGVLGWTVTLTTIEDKSEVEDVFIFADDADLSISEQKAPINMVPASDDPKIEKVRSVAPAKAEKKTESIRVASSRVDAMMDALGELVIAQARLDEISSEFADPNLGTVVEDVQRLVMGLRDATLSIRMLPIEAVFGKFRRVVRDLSADLGKDVLLISEGGETEVDKNVIDRIGDPLVHMIRNSVDHGLETAQERVAAGKSAQGTVWLSARQEGGEIIVSIEDDGRGLNAGAIHARALERGLIDPDAELTDTDLHQLIFEPGFSTAETVSAVSGRGVGMDAVKTTIDNLGGSIDVLSRPGFGTRIMLRLPVTLAIIDGLRVRLGNSVFVIPLSAVEECVEFEQADDVARSGRSVLEIRDEMVPYLALDELFNQPAEENARRRVVVVRVDGARAGLVVDDILGQSQIVIKALSPYHKDIPGLGGATILGDGRVALIVDVATLIRSAEARRSSPNKKAA
jgi:two-component system chemotaxis sensor kinase CheA